MPQVMEPNPWHAASLDQLSEVIPRELAGQDPVAGRRDDYCLGMRAPPYGFPQ